MATTVHGATDGRSPGSRPDPLGISGVGPPPPCRGSATSPKTTAAITGSSGEMLQKTDLNGIRPPPVPGPSSCAPALTPGRSRRATKAHRLGRYSQGLALSRTYSHLDQSLELQPLRDSADRLFRRAAPAWLPSARGSPVCAGKVLFDGHQRGFQRGGECRLALPQQPAHVGSVFLGPLCFSRRAHRCLSGGLCQLMVTHSFLGSLSSSRISLPANLGSGLVICRHMVLVISARGLRSPGRSRPSCAAWRYPMASQRVARGGAGRQSGLTQRGNRLGVWLGFRITEIGHDRVLRVADPGHRRPRA
jgi:hypothetical protein